VLGVGILNAYNFMDGINGITGGYSSVVILALMAVNRYHIRFIEDDFLNFVLIGLMVFNLFNFRTKALCFAGDVGSISIAFIIVFLIIKASVIDQNPIYLLFLSVYGIDSVLTIIQRILLKQNIFKAHRLHLFQLIVHQQKVSHLLVSGMYMLVQALVCGLVFFWLDYAFILQLQFGLVIILLLALVYYIVKKRISS
jgi:UDP-N-acetylmuramyl pentapeptide phosphotransferase/UDP-N-acetylglucosamine-1-phosphate transferase